MALATSRRVYPRTVGGNLRQFMTTWDTSAFAVGEIKLLILRRERGGNTAQIQVRDFISLEYHRHTTLVANLNYYRSVVSEL